jgi:arabinan endo-1,5-alpha-L-arabinosidase
MDVGSWEDLGSTGIESVSGNNYNAIDGNLVLAGDTYHMTFGSFWADIFHVCSTLYYALFLCLMWSA